MPAPPTRLSNQGPVDVARWNAPSAGEGTPAGAGGPPPPRDEKSGVPLALVGILALAAGLRASGLRRFPFEQDELYTILESTHLFDVQLRPGIEARPLYYLIQHPLLSIFPESPLALRALPFLFGMLGIVVTWRLAERVAGRTAGLAAALLLTLSPWHLYASGMARYWSLVYLLSALFLLLLARALVTDRGRDYLAALVPLVLGSATHPSFVFPMAGAVLGTCLVRPEGRIGWSWPTLRAWTHLWIPYASLLGVGLATLRWMENETALRNWSGRGGEALLLLVPAIVDWMTPTLAAAGLLGALLLLRAPLLPWQRRWGMLTLVGSAGTLALLAIAALASDTYADYAIGMLPLAVVAAGALVGWIDDRVGVAGGRVLAATALLAVAAMGPSALSHLLSGTRFDYRPAFEFIRETAPEVTVASWPIALQRHYAPDLRGIELRTAAERMEQRLREERELWLVVSVQRHGIVGDAGDFAPWLRSRCALQDAYQAPRLDYRLYRVEVHRCDSARTALRGG